jgi:hypothetical protein
MPESGPQPISTPSASTTPSGDSPAPFLPAPSPAAESPTPARPSWIPWQRAGAGASAESRPIELDGEPFELSDAGNEEAAPAAPTRSRTRQIVLSSLLVVGLAGAAVLGWAAWQITSQKDATMTTPAQVAGLRLDDSQSGQDTADYLQTALVAEVDLDKAVGAVYTDGASRSVLFFGGTALIWSPGDELETAFGLVSDDQGSVDNVHDIPAGKLGGTMKCGTTQTPDGVMPVCGWADHGSLALAMFPKRSEAESATLLRQIRDVTQKRN